MAIRQLLASGRPASRGRRDRDATPRDRLTPESYLATPGSTVRGLTRSFEDRFATYRFPASLGLNDLAYAGRWRVSSEESTAGFGARMQLHFQARKVFLVLGGEGTVEVFVDGKRHRTVPVLGIDRLYTIARFTELREGILELRFSPGVAGYAFTFG